MARPPDDGYRVAARIESRSGRRGRVLAVLFGFVVVAWGATVLGSGPADRGDRTADSGRIADDTGPPGSRPPTFPPDVTILDPRAPTAKLPIRLAGLELLDPRAGTVESLAPVSWLQFPFATADGGSACICVEPGTETGAESVIHAMSFADTGQLVQDLLVPGWLSLSDADGIAIEARRIPGGQAFVVASAIKHGGEWSVRLDWLDAASGDRASQIVDTVGRATWSSAYVAIRLAIAPDGRQLRLWLGAEPSGEPASPPPSAPRIWTVPIEDRGFGPPVPREEPGTDDPSRLCQGEAWASPTVFVRLCDADLGDGSGAVRTTLRIDRGAGRFDDVEVASGPPQESVGWLVDGARGVVYGWYAKSHRLVRIDVATARLTDRYPGDGRTNLLGIPPEASPPPPGVGTAIWQPFTGALSPLVGSPDGSVVYVVGLMPRTSTLGVSAYESTGIWAFDVSSLALVGHWAAAADYSVLAATADGGTLVAFGPPGGREVTQFGNHGPLIVFHDARDGSVLGVLRGLTLRAGGDPQPLEPALPGGFGG